MTSPTNLSPSAGDATKATAIVESHQIDRYILLHDGYTILEIFYEVVRQQVDEGLPDLERDASYTAKRLCGKEFWRHLNNGERRMAGRCIAYMVTRNLLPLTFAETRHEYPKKYQLK